MTKFSSVLLFLSANAWSVEPPTPAEHWSKAYRDLHEIVVKIDSEVARNYLPEVMMIRDGSTVASLQIDGFSARVLRETDNALLPYREGIQTCVDANHNEYRTAQSTSIEAFGWFLDSYVRMLVKSLGAPGEPEMVNGVRERKVTTDRVVYAFTRLLTSYLGEREQKFAHVESYAFDSDRAVANALNDLARRVFRLDLNQKFDYKSAMEKGLKSQPGLRDLASNEGGADPSSGLAPLIRISTPANSEPLCKITLPSKDRKIATGQ